MLHKAHVVGLELWSLLVVFQAFLSDISSLEGAATVTISTNFQWKYLVKKRGRRSELFFSVLLGIELPELLQ